jgi:hypothetical protein
MMNSACSMHGEEEWVQNIVGKYEGNRPHCSYRRRSRSDDNVKSVFNEVRM